MIDSNILLNAIRDALREMDKCPDDDVSTIWNEQFKSWELPLHMDDGYSVEFRTDLIRNLC
jgi:hypothetical protein